MILGSNIFFNKEYFIDSQTFSIGFKSEHSAGLLLHLMNPKTLECIGWYASDPAVCGLKDGKSAIR